MIEPTPDEIRDLRLLAPGYCGDPSCPPETCSLAKRGRAIVALIDAYAARSAMLARIEEVVRIYEEQASHLCGADYHFKNAIGFNSISSLLRAARGAQ